MTEKIKRILGNCCDGLKKLSCKSADFLKKAFLCTKKVLQDKVFPFAKKLWACVLKFTGEVFVPFINKVCKAILKLLKETVLPFIKKVCSIVKAFGVNKMLPVLKKAWNAAFAFYVNRIAPVFKAALKLLKKLFAPVFVPIIKFLSTYFKKAWIFSSKYLLAARKWMVSHQSLSASIVLGAAVVATFAVLSVSAREVRVVDGNTVSTVYTISKDPQSILRRYGFNPSPYDRIEVVGSFKDGAQIVLNRAFPVSVSADGKTNTFYLSSGTVSEVLSMAGVTLGPDDLINIAPDASICTGADIVVNRVSYENEVVKETIPYTINQRGSPLILKRGRVVVISAGKNGEKEVTMKRKIVDGVEVTREVIEEKVLVSPVEEVSLIGIDTSTPVSPFSLPAGVTLDANGVPTSYKAVFEGKATAYTAPKGALTYSGRKAIVGHVATHKTDIPMGSKLYIVGTGKTKALFTARQLPQIRAPQLCKDEFSWISSSKPIRNLAGSALSRSRSTFWNNKPKINTIY